VEFRVGLLLLVGLVPLTSSRFFPFFPLFWVHPFFEMLTLRIAAMRHEGTPVRVKPIPSPSKESKERALLEALECRGEITAARAPLEASLSVAQADEMLSELAAEGHIEVRGHAGTLAYAMCKRDRRQAQSEELPGSTERRSDQGPAEGDPRG
jgi:hypothetical protein